MKKINIIILINLLSKIVSGQVCHSAISTMPENGICDENYVLVFEDNFDGKTLDLSKWQIQPWKQGFTDEPGNAKIYYTLNNANLSNGNCYITAKRETVTAATVIGGNDIRTYDYTSSNIWTKNKYGYGIYEIKCKIPKGKGLWPAFWMYGKEEIDVFEFWNEYNKINCLYDESKLSKVANMTLHNQNNSCSSKFEGPDFSTSQHVFSVNWSPYKITWFIDGVQAKVVYKYHKPGISSINGIPIESWDAQLIENSLINSTPIECWNNNQIAIRNTDFPSSDPMNIVASLNVQAGNNSKDIPCFLALQTNDPNTETLFPSSYEIDYIRYYKSISCQPMAYVTPTNFNDVINTPVTASTIEVIGNVTIQNGQQIELIARDIININPGFSVEPGGDFFARIDPTMCLGKSMYESPDNNSKIETATGTINQTENLFNVSPNPNNGIFSVNVGSDNIKNIYVYDLLSKVVYQKTNSSDQKFEIDITNQPKGIYIVKVVDGDNVKMFKVINQ